MRRHRLHSKPGRCSSRETTGDSGCGERWLLDRVFSRSRKESSGLARHADLGEGAEGHSTRSLFFRRSGELQVSLGGQFRDYPPDDETGSLKFAESLEHPELFRTIQHAIPTSPVATYRFPAHVWNHYDRLKKCPSNLLVLGDALCSFNPIYGQGMTVAAHEAQVLHVCLADASRRGDDAVRLRDRYFRGVSSIMKAASAMATGEDLAYPQAEGQRPFGQTTILRYLGHVIALSCYDKRVLTVWNQVTNMQWPLSALFAPSAAARVMRRAVVGGPPLNAQRP